MIKGKAIDLLKIYKPISGLDWLNYRIDRSQMTLHHIKKRSEGGTMSVDNLCPLLSVGHQYLHLIECKDVDTYNAINKVFKYVNNQGYEPTREQREFIEYLLRGFESEHKWDKGSKGRLLIKEKYLNRW